MRARRLLLPFHLSALSFAALLAGVAPPAQATAPACVDLGPAKGTGVFVVNGFTGTSSDVEGSGVQSCGQRFIAAA